MLVWRWRQSRRHGPLLPVNRQRPADFIFPMAATVIPPHPRIPRPADLPIPLRHFRPNFSTSLSRQFCVLSPENFRDDTLLEFRPLSSLKPAPCATGRFLPRFETVTALEGRNGATRASLFRRVKPSSFRIAARFSPVGNFMRAKKKKKSLTLSKRKRISHFYSVLSFILKTKDMFILYIKVKT